MERLLCRLVTCLVSMLAVAGLHAAPAQYVQDPTQEIPLIQQVDVLVVGGTTSGVAAAVEAAAGGAKVFLAAPRPYLGEDLCATYRLWLEPGEAPTSKLARNLFEPAPAMRPMGPGLAFTYQADKPSAAIHADTDPPSRLGDGAFSSAAAQSVQYDGDVTITLSLTKSAEVDRVHILFYQRPGDFDLDSAAIAAAGEGGAWHEIDAVSNAHPGDATEDRALSLSVPVGRKTSILRLDLRKTQSARRILLGEIVVEPVASASETVAAEQPVMVAPMQVKRCLDNALLDANVEFLTGCFVSELLYDADGNCAGAVIVNRSGRQAVAAKVIIDATWRAQVARTAGATARPYPAGQATFQRVAVTGDAPSVREMQVRTIRTTVPTRKDPSQPYVAAQYTLSLDMPSASWPSFARAEQAARDLTWDLGQADASEVIFQVPPDSVLCRKSQTGPWTGPESLDPDAFRPANTDRIFIAGPCADISRQAAETLARPLNMLEVGARLGRLAAAEAMRLPATAAVLVRPGESSPTLTGSVHEDRAAAHPRFADYPTVSAQSRTLPVWGEYDVVVVGGGTGGAPAGIAAARQGARTLVIEYLHGLGGVGTLGLISKYYHGNRVGFTAEIDEGVRRFGPDAEGPGGWNVEWKMEWYRRELLKAGADLWFGTLGWGAFVENGRVKGVAVANDFGAGVVLARVVIDATGSAVIAAAAGSQTDYVGAADIAMQGTGLPARALGAGYTNTDYNFIDDLDIVDSSSALLLGRDKFRDAYDMGQLIDTRERRRVVGDFVIDPLDIWNHRTYPDTVVICRSNFDTHGYTVHPVFTIRPPDRDDIDVDLPYRALLPRGLDGIIVTGLAAAAHRDAMPVIRMQPDVQNQGYAMGVAAAMLAGQNKSTRQLDVKALQRHLIEKNILPQRVLTDTDSFPIRLGEIIDGVRRLADDYDGIQTALVDPAAAMLPLRMAYAGAASDKSRLIYAHVLAMLGDPSGVETLAAAVSAMPWDKGWRYTGMGQFGPSMSRLDSYIIALGMTKDRRAVAPILARVAQLNADSEFSHHRAVALALESIGDPAAAEPLAALLARPGMTGHAHLDVRRVRSEQPRDATDTSTRNRSLAELILARALYLCGDHNGVGERILRQYCHDLRGHYARHARAVLDGPRPARQTVPISEPKPPTP